MVFGGNAVPLRENTFVFWTKTVVFGRSQKISLRSQTVHSKWTAYDTTKYQTFLTKDGKVCPFERTFVISRGKAYHILLYPLFWEE